MFRAQEENLDFQEKKEKEAIKDLVKKGQGVRLVSQENLDYLVPTQITHPYTLMPKVFQETKDRKEIKDVTVQKVTPDFPDHG